LEDTNTNGVWRQSDSYGKGNESRNEIANSGHRRRNSGWSMNNPMYRAVHGGIYLRASGGCNGRVAARQKGESFCKHKKFWEL
jgi:hypothetical protein